MKRRNRTIGFSKLLNRPGFHSTAAIAAKITMENHWFDATINISDCDRRISLDCDATTLSEVRNSLHKIDTLIAVLTKFRDAFEREAYANLEYQKNRKKKL